MGPIFVIVALVGIALLVTRRQHVATVKAWSTVAHEFGLDLQPGSFIANPQLTGEIRGLQIKVWVYTSGGGRSRSTHTGYRVSHAPVGPDVTLRRQGSVSFMRKIFGGRDVKIGDPAFDDAVIIDANEPEAIAEFLSPARRAAVLSLFEGWRTAVITNDSIQLSVNGRSRVPTQMGSLLTRLIDTAVVLQSPNAVDHALATRDAGDLGDAAAELGSINSGMPNAFTELLEAEALTALGRTNEAEAVFQHVAELLEGDDQVEKLRVANHRAAIHLGGATRAEPGNAIGWRELVDDLFGERRRGYEVVDRFDEHHLGRTVSWDGEITRLRPFRFDSDFDGDPGVKVTIQLGSMDEARVMSTKIEAVVRLPAEVDLDLGQHVRFTGRLLRVDRFSKALYVDDGRLID